MIYKKKIIYFLIAIIAIIAMVVLCNHTGSRTPDTLRIKAKELRLYCKKNGYSTDIAILVDYSVHSGCTRFFVWDFNRDKTVLESICAQGCGKGKNEGKNVFSNENGSLCSSLGHYKIGKEKTMNSPKGRPAFILYGLDKTNSNAYKRGILLHPVYLPPTVIYPFKIPVAKFELFGKTIIRPYSEGCVTIPFDKYHKVAKILRGTEKPVIMWVYN